MSDSHSQPLGDALMYRELLDNTLLRDPTEGANCFKNTLKKSFLKGATNVYISLSVARVSHLHPQVQDLATKT